jgi:hypothetical protein
LRQLLDFSLGKSAAYTRLVTGFLYFLLISTNLPQDAICTQESPYEIPPLPRFSGGEGRGEGVNVGFSPSPSPSPSRAREFAED